MNDADDPLAEIKADIEADRLRRQQRNRKYRANLTEERKAEIKATTATWRKNQTPEYRKKRNALSKAWHDRQPQEYKDKRLAALQARMTRKELTEHKHRYRRKTKAKLVIMFGDKCHDCGNTFPHVCYDFHHTDPNKKTSIVAVMYQHKWETVLKEVEGCIMICANCHRIRHAQERDD